ncbi:MAG TPA: ABC transporter permease [Opitutus sp.]|nr:ABC transporter permease [Opitutus sp.]
MRVRSTIIIALRALRRNKLRSMLTALGIIIGVGAVIAMVSIGNGAKSQVEAQVASLGQNVVTVFSGSFTGGGMRGGWGSAPTLTPEDAAAIASEIGNIVGVSPEVRDRNQILANGLNWNTQVLGESPDYPEIRSWPIAEGTVFSEQDVRSVAKVAIIGKTVADQLFPGGDAVGQTIRIRNIPFKVVGQLAPKGFNLFGQDQDDVVIVPYTSHMKRLSRRTNVNSILIQARSADVIERVQQDVTDLLTQRRNGKEPDFTVRNQVELAQTATATTRTMTTFLLFTACISLIVGGIGIMNIMLVSVTERTREIGIRLAVGAHGRDVLLQFVIEAVLLSSMGGLIGILLGVGASAAVKHFVGWPVLVSPFWIILSFGVSAIVGLFFGFYPARKAAQLDPIDALRYE